MPLQGERIVQYKVNVNENTILWRGLWISKHCRSPSLVYILPWSALLTDYMYIYTLVGIHAGGSIVLVVIHQLGELTV